MKKWLWAWIVIFGLISYGAYQLKPIVAGDKQKQADVQTGQGISPKNGRTIKVESKQIYQGNLILVNKDYPVHQEGVQSDIVKLSQHKELVQGYGLLDNTIRLSQSVAQRFESMIDAAAKDGVTHFLISSGYRDKKEQDELYREMGADYALPAGYSEHNLGLSLDIGSSQMEMNRAPEGKWLAQHAWAYGFILRYPKDKTEITGIQYEPWHFRYVGLPHSAIMQEKQFTLEQYLDYLKTQKTITATVEGKRYEVSYYPVSRNASIQVPAGRRYELSGNNTDGVIVTVFP
ncbi:VanY-A/VanY-F/VanY-M family D-Ala-D-Ala carboxypeptidase [Paenibacillus doosanensis]|uniref:VanY-A/VanY-F/VanY-M family D-Ala-D-Ala carboxypeptidase n=1 Tax=Paenibacillus doosanensis TaxID=1229154 RepID=UPI00217F51FD|nr:VanY-A/VanY-F/VanY-M family D-Ala-D-Ala carboxypeptidase [Paenibacillus doosanensis]MCS7461363.1 VanY-A/VanY-F/VanY-M family D-Ala-D-Ala carboxypeptidase [Paenibacillus doosanensis]